MTVLPRRYIIGHNNPKIGSRWHRFSDFFMLLKSLLTINDGAMTFYDQVHDAVANSDPGRVVSCWNSELGRQVEVRRRKYFWVGYSIIMSIASVMFMILGVVVAVYISGKAVQGV